MAYKNIEDQRAASKAHYLKNKSKYLMRNKTYRLQIKDFIKRIKEDHPCMDCGNRYPYYVMDFDHREGEKKSNDINFLSNTGRIGAVKVEIAKCDLVCANCHRVRTHNRYISKQSSLLSSAG